MFDEINATDLVNEDSPVSSGLSGGNDTTDHLWVLSYIRNQLQEDIMADQISLKEFTDPFTGEAVNKGK